MSPTIEALFAASGDAVRERVLRAVPWVLFVAAAAIRTVVATHSVDIPGDGPVHAMYAFEWAQSPVLLESGMWLPGFTYGAGLVTRIVGDPRVAPRLFNVVVGSATVPLLYGLSRQLYGTAPALVAALLLTLLPLHVGLSASSLTEPNFVFALVAALYGLLRAAAVRPSRPVDLLLFLLAFIWAELSRYEAWLLIPLVVGYWFSQRRTVWSTGALTVAFLAIPLAWSIGNHSVYGNALLGFSQAVREVDGVQRVTAWVAAGIVRAGVTRHLGWLVGMVIAWGIATEIVRVGRGRGSSERGVYLMFTIACWAMLFAFAMSRGASLWDRYLLLAFAVGLPFAGVGWPAVLSSRPWGVAGVASVLLLSLVATYVEHPANVFVTARQPLEIQRLIVWLRSGPYRDEAILLTQMDWDSTYLPLLAPEWAGRAQTVSNWISDGALRDFVEHDAPALLITRAYDAAQRQRAARLLGMAIDDDHRVAELGSIQIYRLRDVAVRETSR